MRVGIFRKYCKEIEQEISKKLMIPGSILEWPGLKVKGKRNLKSLTILTVKERLNQYHLSIKRTERINWSDILTDDEEVRRDMARFIKKCTIRKPEDIWDVERWDWKTIEEVNWSRKKRIQYGEYAKEDKHYTAKTR